ncbi:MAG: DUF1223 domain-containing protein [Hyphomonadaceae bacterium]|nr:DUF1223 domain-containing protein [Hyphomonadaceae bacterium]
MPDMRNALILLFSTLMLAVPAMAQPVLVELFSSHNCPACPQAHRTMAQVDHERDDVLILTWSVDYWDYLGEPDPMAMDISTQRQEAYVERFNLRGPYTPQTVYNGAAQCQGNKPSDVALRLSEVEETPIPGIAIRETEFGWTVDVPPGVDCEVHLIRFRAMGDHVTDMVNPVTGMDTLAHLQRGGAVSLSQSCESGCALLVQAPDHGVVYGVQRIQ